MKAGACDNISSCQSTRNAPRRLKLFIRYLALAWAGSWTGAKGGAAVRSKVRVEIKVSVETTARIEIKVSVELAVGPKICVRAKVKGRIKARVKVKIEATANVRARGRARVRVRATSRIRAKARGEARAQIGAGAEARGERCEMGKMGALSVKGDDVIIRNLWPAKPIPDTPCLVPPTHGGKAAPTLSLTVSDRQRLTTNKRTTAHHHDVRQAKVRQKRERKREKKDAGKKRKRPRGRSEGRQGQKSAGVETGRKNDTRRAPSEPPAHRSGDRAAKTVRKRKTTHAPE